MQMRRQGSGGMAEVASRSHKISKSVFSNGPQTSFDGLGLPRVPNAPELFQSAASSRQVRSPNMLLSEHSGKYCLRDP